MLWCSLVSIHIGEKLNHRGMIIHNQELKSPARVPRIGLQLLGSSRVLSKVKRTLMQICEAAISCGNL